MTKTKKHKTEESNKKQHKENKAKHAEHKEKVPAKKVPGNLFSIISAVVLIIILVLVIVLLVRKPDGGNGGTSGMTGDKAKVEFYVMSQCPYGTQVEDAFYPVLQQMGDAIDFHLDYIVQESSPGQFQSLHGEPEVIGDLVQVCAIKYYPDNYKYMDFIMCQNKDVSNVHTNWVTCANQNQMDVTKLRTCLEGDEGKNLLRESMQRAQAREARGSPTMFVADAPYQGQRDALSFQRAICKVVEHDACDAIPACASGADCTEQEGKIGVCNNAGQTDAFCTYEEPVELNYVVLNSADCTGQACDASRIVSVTQQLFLGGKPKVVDVDSPEGKQLVEKYGIEVVPAFIFESNIVDTKSWKERTDLQTAFDKVGDAYKLKDEATGADFYISEEARQAKYDAIGVTLGDNRPQIDFFVMSYCPYGNQAEESIEPVYQLLKDVADFNPRYVIYSNYGGGGPNYCIDAENQLCSMHGVVELHQDIREACVAKYIGMDEWFEFALKMNTETTSQNADDKWEAVAKGLGLDVAVINKCFDEEGEALMAANKELGDLLGVSGSPSVFIDGNSYSGGRTPEAFKQGLCAAFDTPPSECSTALEGDAAAPASGSC